MDLFIASPPGRVVNTVIDFHGPREGVSAYADTRQLEGVGSIPQGEPKTSTMVQQPQSQAGPSIWACDWRYCRRANGLGGRSAERERPKARPVHGAGYGAPASPRLPSAGPRHLALTRCPKNNGVLEEQLVTTVTAAEAGSLACCLGAAAAGRPYSTIDSGLPASLTLAYGEARRPQSRRMTEYGRIKAGSHGK